jgi:hypothetical protein
MADACALRTPRERRHQESYKLTDNFLFTARLNNAFGPGCAL